MFGEYCEEAEVVDRSLNIALVSVYCNIAQGDPAFSIPVVWRDCACVQALNLAWGIVESDAGIQGDGNVGVDLCVDSQRRQSSW